MSVTGIKKLLDFLNDFGFCINACETQTWQGVGVPLKMYLLKMRKIWEVWTPPSYMVSQTTKQSVMVQNHWKIYRITPYISAGLYPATRRLPAMKTTTRAIVYNTIYFIEQGLCGYKPLCITPWLIKRARPDNRNLEVLTRFYMIFAFLLLWNILTVGKLHLSQAIF